VDCLTRLIGLQFFGGITMKSGPQNTRRGARAKSVNGTDVFNRLWRRLIPLIATTMVCSATLSAISIGNINAASAAVSAQHVGSTSQQAGGKEAHFSTSYALYSQGEFYDGSNPSAVCYTCTAADITGSAPPSESLDGGAGVDPVTGDFSTSNTLFGGAGQTNSMGLSLNYDAQLAQFELNAGTGALNPFGVGWNSNFGASATEVTSGGVTSATINQGNGSQVTFTQSASSGTATTCSPGDYSTTNKYTWSSSSHQWCALASVQGQLDDIPTSQILFYEDGGQYEEAFAWTGGLTYQGPSPSIAADQSSIYYNVAAGSQSSFTSNPEQKCPTAANHCTIINSGDAQRDIVEALNSSGETTEVIDPSGVTYALSYDINNNLTAIKDYANQTSPSTWSYVYDTGQSSPNSSDMTEIYDPDSGVGSSPSFSSGAAHSTAMVYNNSGSDSGMVSSITDGTGATTTYSYADACQSGQCFGPTLSAPQQTTITYPAQVPYPGGTAVSPVEVENYVSGVESSTKLGSTSVAANSETWSYAWGFGYGAGNSTETIFYPDSLSGTSPQATVTLDAAGNVVQTENVSGEYATSDYNDVGGNDLPELLWSYPGSATTPGTAPTGSEVYTYNSYGQTVTATDPLGNVTNFGYYASGSEICYVAPPTVSISGSPPNCSGTGTAGPSTTPAVGSTAYTYDGYGDVTADAVDYRDTATGSDPQTTTASYNVMGDLLWSISPPGQSGSQSSSNSYATVNTYTPANLPLTVTPPGQGTTTNTYDAALNLDISAAPAATTTTIFDADNRPCYQVVESWSPTGLSCSSSNQGGSHAFTYVPGSTNVASSTDSNADTTSYYYSDLAYPNQATEVVDPSAAAQQYTAYNDFGDACVSGDVSLASQQATANQCVTLSGDTSTTVNALGDETSITDPSGNTTTNAFTNTSYPTSITSTTNALSASTSFSYDADGDVIKTTNPDSSVVNTAYDADGRICTQSDTSTSYGCGAGSGVSGVVNYTYNGASDRTSMVSYSPSSATTSYSYANGQLTSTTDANSKIVSYVYNYAGQVACEGYPVDVTSGCGTYSSLGTGSSTNTIVKDTYDSAGRRSTVVDWLGNTTTYAYTNPWNPGQPTSITYPSASGVSATYGYDNDSNLTSLSAGTSSLTSINDSWRFDADERAGTATVNSVASSWASYNANNQITGATNLATSTSNDVYTVAKNGEITRDAPPSGSTTSFAYNAGDELCWSANVASSAACSSPPAASVETNYTYTTNGQRASAATTTGSGTATTNYAWNPYGELCNVSSTATACGSMPTSGTSYLYNGDGLRTTATTPATTAGTISAVGSLAQGFSTGGTTVSVNPQHVGDALVLAVGVFAPGFTVSSVSGGGSTGWTKLSGSTANGSDTELWLGTVTTTGSSTISVTFSSSVAGKITEIDAQEYQSSTGSSTTWSLDVAANAGTTTSSTTINLPTLAPTGSGELYVDYTNVNNTAVAGSTSGVTYDVTSAVDLFAYDPSVSASLSPTAGQTPTGTYAEAAALLTATTSSGSSVTDSTWDVVSGGSIPLNVNDATTSSGSTTNTSYLYGNLLFGGTAPVEQITTTSSGSTVRYLVSNQTGVQGVYSSSGALQELALYSLYGVQTIMSGSKVTPFGFQGSYTDSTGLVYLIDRYFDPSTDQFPSVDPDVGLTDQPYAFTNDEPLNTSDPFGLYASSGSGETAFVTATTKKTSTGTTTKTKTLVKSGTKTLSTSVTYSTTPIVVPIGMGFIYTISASATFSQPASQSSPSLDLGSDGSVSVTADGVTASASDGGPTSEMGIPFDTPGSSSNNTFKVGGDEVTTTISVKFKYVPQQDYYSFSVDDGLAADGAAATFVGGVVAWLFLTGTKVVAPLSG
jgi:RHS repeat-associated protein